MFPPRLVRNLAIFYLGIALTVAGLVGAKFYPGLFAAPMQGMQGGMAWVGGSLDRFLPGLMSWVTLDADTTRSILRQGLPATWASPPSPPEAENIEHDVRSVLRALTSYDLANPRSFFDAEIPTFALRGAATPVPPAANGTGSTGTGGGHPSGPPVEQASGRGDAAAGGDPSNGRDGGTGTLPREPRLPDSPEAERPEDPGPPDWQERLRRVNWGTEPLVAIYHAHTSEMYRTDTFAPANPTDYRRWNTTDTGIVQVGGALQSVLQERYGVPVYHDTTIHDWPQHIRAYSRSRTTVQQLLERFPSLQIILDVHRDAPAGMVTTIGGREVGQVMLVVGTAEESDLEHADPGRNLEFAQALQERMDALYPGLMRRIWVREDRRFNQDLHPRALLLEIGSYDTHLNKALATTELIADVIASMLLDIRRDTPVEVTAPRPSPTSRPR